MLKPVILLFLVAGIVALSGCAGMKQLRMENEQLRSEIARLQQIEDDYSDKLREVESLSEADKRRMLAEIGDMQKRLSANLQDQIEKNEALVDKVRDLAVIEIGEAALFASGEADLTRRGTKVIRQVTAVLNNYPGYQIRVEGHTDSLPIGKILKGRFVSNWELSTARATHVVKYMIYGLKVDPARLQAVGYAQYRPVASNDTEASRAKNRRIRVVVFKKMESQLSHLQSKKAR